MQIDPTLSLAHGIALAIAQCRRRVQLSAACVVMFSFAYVAGTIMNCSWQTAMSTGIRGSLLAAASRDSGCCQLFRRVHGVLVIALAVSVPAMV